MGNDAEQIFMKHLQNNPPHVIAMVNDLIAWMRSVFGEPEWFSNKESNVNIRVGKFVVFGLCAGRYPDEPAHNRALISFRRTHGYEMLVERLKSISPKISEHVTKRAERIGFNLHIDMFNNDQELQMLKGILLDHVEQQNGYLEGRSPAMQLITSEQTQAIPTKEDFEAAYRKLVRPGEAVSIDAVLDQIEVNAKKDGFLLKSDWRMITEMNITSWSTTL